MAWRRDRRKEQLWRRLVREQAQSGRSVREFCNARGLAESAFYFWRRELQARDGKEGRIKTRAVSAASSASAAPSFAAVTVTELDSLSPAIEVVLTSGVRVRIPSGFDPQTLREVLSLLEQPAC
jgi:transposase-like protein